MQTLATASRADQTRALSLSTIAFTRHSPSVIPSDVKIA